jgi:glycosyltransferase involved in cell wall biosynthesis
MSYSTPLVSCIMPTRNRRRWIRQAIEYFRRQDYPHLELVIVDDGADRIEDMIPAGLAVRYVYLQRPASIGSKRNIAVEHASGDFIVHWDDDDWYGPRRVRHQLQPLLAGAAVSGLQTGMILQLLELSFWRCNAALHARMFYADVHGGTIAYSRRLWQETARFPDSSLAEDAAFLRAIGGRPRVAALPAEETFVYVRHGGNAWEFACGHMIDPGGWASVPSPEWLPSDDLKFYRDLSMSLSADSTILKRAGDTYRSAGQYVIAEKYYVRAVTVDPNNVWAWFDRGLCLERVGSLEDALQAVQTADRLLHPQDGNRTWIHSELGQIYKALGRQSEARGEFETALRHYRRNHQALAGLRAMGK